MTEVLCAVLQCVVYASIIYMSRYRSFIWSWLGMTVWLYGVGAFWIVSVGFDGCLKLETILVIYLSAAGFCAVTKGYIRWRMRRRGGKSGAPGKEKKSR